MDLQLDVLRSIVLLLRINHIKNLCSVDKFFYSLCNEKNLWLEKFKENNLEIINDDINIVGHYINEYKKVSYAVYTVNCLIDMIKLNKTGRFSIDYHVCWFRVLIDDLINILPKDHQVFIKIKDNNYTKKYINISIAIGDEDTIGYSTDENPDDENNEMIMILNEKYNDKNVIISLFTKILYYYPLIFINDINYLPIIISESENKIFEKCSTMIIDYFDKNIIKIRKRYWDECYSKYENLYF